MAPYQYTPDSSDQTLVRVARYRYGFPYEIFEIIVCRHVTVSMKTLISTTVESEDANDFLYGLVKDDSNIS